MDSTKINNTINPTGSVTNTNDYKYSTIVTKNDKDEFVYDNIGNKHNSDSIIKVSPDMKYYTRLDFGRNVSSSKTINEGTINAIDILNKKEQLDGTTTKNDSFILNEGNSTTINSVDENMKTSEYPQGKAISNDYTYEVKSEQNIFKIYNDFEKAKNQ